MVEGKRNISLSMRMALGFGIPLLMVSIVVIVIFLIANNVQSNAKLARDESAVFAETARHMRVDVIQVQQWLSDISATRAQDGLDDGFDEAEASAQSFAAGAAKFRDMFERENDPKALQQVDELETAFAAYYQAGTAMAKEYIRGGAEAGNKLMGVFDEAAQSLTSALEPFARSQQEELDQAMNSIVASTAMLRTTTMIFGISTLSLGILLAWWITRSITKVLNRIAGSLSEGSEQVASASGQVSMASQSLANGATEQAAGLQETSSSLEEISSITGHNADNAQEAKNLATRTRQAADTGAESMSKMNVAIRDIQKSADETAKVLKVIDDIAFQTNLLALNAAVEAARAGEAGKGFAVVAEEVRNLAMRSAEAAKNTANMIEESVKNAQNGVDIADEASKALEEIVQNVGKTTNLVSDIASASKEQAQGVDQVNSAVSQMDKITQQNAATAEESASAAEELSAQAESMADVVTHLVTLIKGASAKKGKSPTAARHNAGTRAKRQTAGRPGFAASDKTWHQISDGGPRAAQSDAQHAIPLDGDDANFNDFNG